MLLCDLYQIIGRVLQIYVLVMLVYALISWVPSIRGQWTQWVARLVEPVLTPVRRIIPPIAGLDLSFLVVVFLIQWVAQLAFRQAQLCLY